MVCWVWNEERWGDEDSRVRVVNNYKTGDPTQQKNNCPRSLLNTMHKIIAALLKRKLMPGLEPHLWPTQFGFKPGRSTADAIHDVVRRLQDHLESSGDPGMMCLLDWEKAFDKLKPEALIVALRKYGVHPKLVALVQMLYHSSRASS